MSTSTNTPDTISGMIDNLFTKVGVLNEELDNYLDRTSDVRHIEAVKEGTLDSAPQPVIDCQMIEHLKNITHGVSRAIMKIRDANDTLAL
jgi:hypothetical protein